MSFHDIGEFATKHHDNHLHCTQGACDVSYQTFQSHVPNAATMSNYKMLLLEKSNLVSLSPTQQRAMVKSHFMVLAQKFHPDKNNKANKTQCTDIMITINKAYNDLLQEITMNESISREVVREGYIYDKINECTVTCQHHDSYAIYGYVDHISTWTTKLKEMWGESPKTLPKGSHKESPGKQFGNKNKSLYISIYHNGTIFIQGCMALQYATEMIQPM